MGSKISFIIPAYNEESLIGKCLESIQRELARGAYEAEVVVVDNGSTDRTLEVARSFAGVRVVEAPRRGANSARKAGWEASSGELVACIDADTELTLVWVDTVIHEFSRDPKLAALTGPFIYRDLPLYLRALVRALYVIAFLLQTLSKPFIHAGAMLQGGNFVLRRRMFDAVGGFNTDIVFYGDDADTAMRIERVGKVRWTFKLPIYASGRRLRQEGTVRTIARYALNHAWMTYLGRPFTQGYSEIRTG